MTNLSIPGPLVSVHWLSEHLDADNLVILDARMPPVTPMDGGNKQEEPSYIPGARRFDFDQEIRDKNSSLPHMMPSPEVFAEEVQKLGMNRSLCWMAACPHGSRLDMRPFHNWQNCQRNREILSRVHTVSCSLTHLMC